MSHAATDVREFEQGEGGGGALDVPGYCTALAGSARAASGALAAASGERRTAALRAMADALDGAVAELKEANAKDLAAAPGLGLSEAMVDRLRLTDARLAGMSQGVRDIAEQADPVGAVLDGRVLPNGIRLLRRRVPLGVVLIIFESRPNVTADAAALCLKSGNAAILRGGKEAFTRTGRSRGACSGGWRRRGCRGRGCSWWGRRTGRRWGRCCRRIGRSMFAFRGGARA